MTNKSKVLLGILGAAAAGVAIGLLVAPDNGKNVRKKIKETAGDWAETVSALFAKGKNEFDNLTDKAKGMKNSAEDKASKIKESFS